MCRTVSRGGHFLPFWPAASPAHLSGSRKVRSTPRKEFWERNTPIPPSFPCALGGLTEAACWPRCQPWQCKTLARSPLLPYLCLLGRNTAYKTTPAAISSYLPQYYAKLFSKCTFIFTFFFFPITYVSEANPFPIYTQVAFSNEIHGTYYFVDGIRQMPLGNSVSRETNIVIMKLQEARLKKSDNICPSLQYWALK